MRSWFSAAAALALFVASVAGGVFPSLAQEGETPPAADVPPRMLTAPPTPVTGGGRVRLRLVKSLQVRDESVDDARWLKANGLALPEFTVPNPNTGAEGNLPAGVPAQYEGGVLVRAVDCGGRVLLVYGPDYSSGRYVVAWNPKTKAIRYALDFASHTAPSPGGGVAPLPVLYAWEDVDGTLYVSTGINGYASEVQGRTGYITALEPKTGRVRWRSQPLVANARTFALVGDAVVCGYGFTAEKDNLVLLEKRTGRTATRIPLRSAPTYILRKGDRVFVRTYDTNYVFAIR